MADQDNIIAVANQDNIIANAFSEKMAARRARAAIEAALLALSTAHGELDLRTRARAIAQTHLTAVRAKMAELRRLDRSLSRYVRACSEGCAGGPAPNCNILTDLRQSVPGGIDSSGCCS